MPPTHDRHLRRVEIGPTATRRRRSCQSLALSCRAPRAPSTDRSHGNMGRDGTSPRCPAPMRRKVFIIIIRCTPLTKVEACARNTSSSRQRRKASAVHPGRLVESVLYRALRHVLSGVHTARRVISTSHSLDSTRDSAANSFFAPLLGSVTLLLGLKSCAQFRRAAHILGAHLGCSWVRGGGAGARSAGSQRVACCDDEV